jgi:hypothetical protein
MRFCGTCGLSLEEREPLPTRREWERTQASIPWPPPDRAPAPDDGTAAGGNGAEAAPGERDPAIRGVAPAERGSERGASWRHARAGTPNRWRSRAEVGLPLAAVAAVAAIILSASHDRKVPGALTYDSRAKPVLVSLRTARQKQLDQERSCHGCVPVATDAGGCSGYGTNWTCDVRTLAGPRRTPVLETYRVTWARNGCWSAVEDCASSPNSGRRLCPPARIEVLQGCISA